MSSDGALDRLPLVLLVDASATSRHWMWRALHRCGVLEAASVRAAREWIARRPDLDVLVVSDELPDGRGGDLVHELARARHPIAARAIVLARAGFDARRFAMHGIPVVERGDMRAVLARLAGWFRSHDTGLAKALLREAERLSA